MNIYSSSLVYFIERVVNWMSNVLGSFDNSRCMSPVFCAVNHVKVIDFIEQIVQSD